MHPRLKAAIKEYFDAKYHDGTGSFAPDGSKQRVIAELNSMCKVFNYGWTVAPGVIWLQDGASGTVWKFNKKNWWVGKRVK
jgi:hypothetical protein